MGKPRSQQLAPYSQERKMTSLPLRVSAFMPPIPEIIQELSTNQPPREPKSQPLIQLHHCIHPRTSVVKVLKAFQKHRILLITKPLSTSCGSLIFYYSWFQSPTPVSKTAMVNEFTIHLSIESGPLAMEGLFNSSRPSVGDRESPSAHLRCAQREKFLLQVPRGVDLM